jgi:hypothetical protein
MAAKTSANGGTATASKGKPAVMTKMDAVRKAMAKLGRDARPVNIRDYVKSQFGIVMSADHASTCKGEILRRAAAKANPGAAKSVPAKPIVAKPSPMAAKPSDSGQGMVAPSQRPVLA